MRLIKQSIERRDGSGSAVLLPEEPEDMWHAYNLIRPSDLLTAPAIRRVVSESATGGSTSTRVHTSLSIRVTSTDFDAGAAQLHVAGRVARENAVAKLGSHHTLDLELGRNFTLTKGEEAGGGGKAGEGWDSVAQATLREAVDATRRAQVWAVVMQEGLANVCLITEHQTVLRQRVESGVPRKRRGGAGGGDHDKGMEKFFATLLGTLTRQIDLGAQPLKPLLLASPGFTASAFQSYIKSRATAVADKALASLLPAVIVAHASSGHLHALNEVLKSPAVLAKLSDTKYARETALMDRFATLLRKDDGRAWYGPREVERAVERGAVGRGGGVLLISNALFRSLDVGERKRWVRLVDQVRDVEGGEVRVLSSMHESGKRLEGLGKIAAILTFPILDLDEDDDADDDDGEADEGGVQI